MATVTGKTSEKIDELLGTTVDKVELDPAGQLVVTKKSGVTTNAGSVGNSVVSAIINAAGRLILSTRQGTTMDVGLVSKPIDAWPVGSVFMSASPTNPNSLLGGGTWVRWGQGRVPISQDSTQAEFDSAEETGGAKTRVLTEFNLPPHAHSINHDHANATFQVSWVDNTETTATGTNVRLNDIANLTPGKMINIVNPSIDIPTYVGNSGNGGGTSEPIPTLPPYITCYMWKRTA